MSAAAAPFVRPDAPSPGAGPWLPWLDGWRGVSLLLVLVGHLTPLGNVAPLGVEMFFVLSGRLMAELLIVRRQPLGAFLWRRMARVWPALWTYVGLLTAALCMSWWFGDQRHVLFGALSALTFTVNYWAGFVSIPYFDHVWSLSVEEHCYLLLAGIAVLAGRRAGPAAAAALLLAALALANGRVQVDGWGRDTFDTYIRTDARAASILFPFALHLLWHGRAGMPRWLSLAAIVPAVWLFLGAAHPIRYELGTLALSVAVVSLDAAPAPVRTLLAARPLRWVGLASFSLYLWQQPFMLFHRAGLPSVLCVAGAVLLGVWSYTRIERPMRHRLVTQGPAATWRVLLGRRLRPAVA